MADNLAYQGDQDLARLERIGGKIFALAQPIMNHTLVVDNIHRIFGNYLEGKSCTAISDGAALYLSEQVQKSKRGDYVVPDGMIVCDRKKIRWDGVHGAPDLVVEVLSPSTEKRDRGIKKDIYESMGVREYWIVNPMTKQVEVWLLQNGRYTLDNVYTIYTEEMLSVLDEEEQAAIEKEFRCSLFDDLVIPLEKIFAWLV